MPNVDPHRPSYIESDSDEAESLVVLEWAIPIAAKVPALRHRVPMAVISMRPASVTSTVPARVITALRANNTVLPTSWCTTATLTAGPTPRLAR
ncbi:hypothetical protein GCM10022409_29790 [Hymenobacter glaciei]|uniref:Uncharacterized protein n=1 Tax=Hymenobacter glaciei TaxID=877209 RepID=A0ABP7UEW8_9BACT